MTVENQNTAPAAPSVADLPASAFPPNVDPAAYAAEMAGKTVGDPTVQTLESIAASRRPDNVPEKFWDAANNRVNTEALLKSYAELERARSAAPKAEEPAAPAAEAPAQPEDSPKITPAKTEGEGEGEAGDTAPAAAPVAQAIESLASKFEAGTIAEEDFAAAEAAGLPRNVVETYFAGLKALEAASTLAAHEAAGGKDAFENARTWAASNLTAADLDYYNSAVANPSTSRQAVEWLVAKHRAANPAEGSFVTESAPAVAAGDVYTAQAQVTADMRSEKYRTDPAFRAEVAAKLARSRTQGSLNMSASYHSRTR